MPGAYSDRLVRSFVRLSVRQLLLKKSSSPKPLKRIVSFLAAWLVVIRSTKFLKKNGSAHYSARGGHLGFSIGFVNISKCFHFRWHKCITNIGKQHEIYRKNMLSMSHGITIQDGVQDGRRTMTNLLIFQNPFILGGINLLIAYGK